MTNDARPARIREVIAALVAAQDETDAFLASLTAEDEPRKIGDGWTVAQVVEHMAIVENGAGRIVSTIAKQVAGVAETSDDPVAPTLARYAVHDPRVHKVVAPEVVLPVHGATVAESAERMRHARARLIAAFEAAAGTALGSATVPHPIFGPLDAYQWGHLAAQHQLRHLAQIRAILST